MKVGAPAVKVVKAVKEEKAEKAEKVEKAEKAEKAARVEKAEKAEARPESPAKRARLETARRRSWARPVRPRRRASLKVPGRPRVPGDHSGARGKMPKGSMIPAACRWAVETAHRRCRLCLFGAAWHWKNLDLDVKSGRLPIRLPFATR